MERPLGRPTRAAWRKEIHDRMSQDDGLGSEIDRYSGRKPEIRAARAKDDHAPQASDDPSEPVTVPSDDAEAASEPMSAETTLSRLGDPDPGQVPPGKQLSGDPPAV